ncbi:MAG: PorP/SprF family type IX secretion system membrane protein [Bacteroidetes bacterium]|nr:PorP/SprF family type IX secretion system membrane protein [Bacteroidota bacterium]MBS1744777.1 PorP/SprF family type IX secretion system membrane protein [Bacteroidota bacterium]
MRQLFSLKVFCISVGLVVGMFLELSAQGIHFSQFYNSPLLTSPANAGLMSDKDYRVSANYRSQWGGVPVPFNTFSVQADLQLLSNKEHTNWLGFGLAALSDRAGDGNLAMTNIGGFIAYHLHLGETSMLSMGVSGAYVQRSVDFAKLSFDAQWDGSDFNTTLSNHERNLSGKAIYTDFGLGINYASFPNEYVYLKAGISVLHLNSPRETFLNESNTLGIRPTANIDLLYKVHYGLIVNPAVYYTQQNGAYQIIFGSLVQTNFGTMAINSYLLAGIYNRWNDALVFTCGYEWKGLRLMASYDYTISNLGQYINHNGAFEFSVRYSGLNNLSNRDSRKIYQCPRF